MANLDFFASAGLLVDVGVERGTTNGSVLVEGLSGLVRE
jgi:hypothetical protein